MFLLKHNLLRLFTFSFIYFGLHFWNDFFLLFQLLSWILLLHFWVFQILIHFVLSCLISFSYCLFAYFEAEGCSLDLFYSHVFLARFHCPGVVILLLILVFLIVTLFWIWLPYFTVACFYVKLFSWTFRKKLGSDDFSNYAELPVLFFWWSFKKYFNLHFRYPGSVLLYLIWTFSFLVSIVSILLSFPALSPSVRPCRPDQCWEFLGAWSSSPFRLVS